MTPRIHGAYHFRSAGPLPSCYGDIKATCDGSSSVILSQPETNIKIVSSSHYVFESMCDVPG